MTKDEANQIITEKMGGCYHCFDLVSVRDGFYTYECKHCLKVVYRNANILQVEPTNPDFFTADQCFNTLWPWMRDDSKHHGWTWHQFMNHILFDHGVIMKWSIIDHYRDDTGFIMMTAEWLKEKK